MPEAAKAHTKAGAEAFITYFWEVIEFAQLTGDVQTLKALASPMCRACNAGVAGIEKVYVDGGHIVGASLTVRSAKAISLTDVGPAVLVRAQVVVNSEPSEAEYGSLKESVPFRGGVARYEVTVVSTSANPWTVSEVTPRD